MSREDFDVLVMEPVGWLRLRHPLRSTGNEGWFGGEKSKTWWNLPERRVHPKQALLHSTEVYHELIHGVQRGLSLREFLMISRFPAA